ncbi:glycosyltransferase family 32 protein [Caenimonas sedimenti]|nr:glycosyltransferase [Caenimonas sedimenti]
MPIPRIIHQTCKDKRALPGELVANIERMRTLNPSWEHRLYENLEMDDFISTHYSADVVGAFRKINPAYGVARADLFKYLLVHQCGGVYLDIKSTAMKPLDEVLQATDHFLLAQWHNKLGDEFQSYGLHPELTTIPGGEFQQWHIVAAPGHPFLAHVVNRALFNIRSYDAGFHGVGAMGVYRTTGPICYTLAIAPHLGKAPFRIVDAREIGFKYSIYPGPPNTHRKILGDYTGLTEAVVL